MLVIWNAWASYKCKWYVHLPNIQNITYACLYLCLNANTILIIEKLIQDQICNLLVLFSIYSIFIHSGFIHGCNPIPDICCFNLWLYIKLLWWVNTIYCFSIVLLIFKLCGRRSRVTENEMDLCTVLLVTSSIVWHASVCSTIVNVTIKGFLIMLRKKVVFTFYFIVR